MKRWWWIGVVVLLFSLGINVGILATLAAKRGAPQPRPPAERPLPEPPPREGGEIPMPHIERMSDELGLDGADRDRFVEIQRQFFQEAARQRRTLEEARRELRRELTSQAPDRERAMALVERTAQAQSGLERALVANILDSREILDPEQERIFAHFVERLVQGPREGPPAQEGPRWRRDLPRFRPPPGGQGLPPRRP